MNRIFLILLALTSALSSCAPAWAADWSNPTTTSTYTNFVTEVKNRDIDVARQFSTAYTAATNIETGTVRWNDTSKKWDLWSGTAWGDLATGYAIAITGNAATATTLQTARTINGVSFNGSANISVNTNNALTFSNAGAGAASGSTFNGSTARTISYNSIGAPSTTGANATGTWGIGITGNAGTVTSGLYSTGSYANPAWLTSLAASKLTGTAAVANGGTGVATLTGVAYGNGTGAFSAATAAQMRTALGAASETASGHVELANNAEATAGADTTRAMTPAGVRAAIDDRLGVTGSAPLFSVRAWVIFDGTLTGTITPLAGGNVSSITKLADGEYRINFTTAMPDANYAATASMQYTSAAIASSYYTNVGNYLTTSVVVKVWNASGASWSPYRVSLMVVR